VKRGGESMKPCSLSCPIQDDGSSGADTEEETDDTTPSSGSVTVLSEKTLDNGQKVRMCVMSSCSPCMYFLLVSIFFLSSVVSTS